MRSLRATLSVLFVLSAAPACNSDPPADDDDSLSSGDDDDSAPLDDDDDSADVGDDDTAESPVVEVCHDGTGDHLTIQAALDAAEAGGTVVICPGEYTEDLVLQGKPLAVRSSDGAAVTTVVGSGVGAVWQILDSDGVVVDGLTVTGGVEEIGGGGLHVEGSTLEVRDCVLTGNSGGFGGGMLAASCDLLLTRTQLSLNEAIHGGGGAYMDETTGEITDCLFHENDSELGGGLGVLDGEMEIRDCEFADNYADASDTSAGGGGVWAYGDVDLVSNTFTGNRSDRYAGGLFALGGAGDILDNRITENSSGDDGGGVYLYTSTSLFSGNEVTHNSASDDAGGLRSRLSSARIEGNVLSFNTADSQGGGAKLSHAAGEFLDNIVEGNVAGDEGGGVELDNDQTRVSGCTFSGNTAEYGGGVHSRDTYDVAVIEDSVFEGNVATRCGGAVYVEDDDHEITLSHLVVVGNRADHGGGICVHSSDAVVRNVVIVGNTATSGGGALYGDDVEGWLQQVSATGNEAPTGSGLYLNQASSLEVINVIVTDNLDGAGVHISGAAPQTWAYNDVFGHAAGSFDGMDDPAGADGNLSGDPRFVDPASADLHLDPTSPCVDAGHPALLDGDGTRSDMGAYGGADGGW